MPARTPLIKGVLPFLIAAFVIWLDQTTKAWVTENLALRESRSILPMLDGWFNLTYIHNSGAAFGIFPQANLIFIVIAIVVVAVILIYYRYLPNEGWFVRLSLGLQLGGALGNLIDRLRFGYVVDFLEFGITDALRLTTFNVADFSIVSGVILLGWYLLFMHPAGSGVAADPSAPDASPSPDGRAPSDASPHASPLG